VLFSVRELKPLAILHDGYIQVYRVACTSALGTRLLAREDAGDVALLGSAGQAWAHLEALAGVRKLNRVRVYSPTVAHREQFAVRARAERGLAVEATESARSAIEGADIVIAATNTSVPIVEGQWLSPGAHVVSIVSGDERMRRRELDDEVFRRAGSVIVHSKAHALEQAHGDLAGPVAAGILSWDRMYDLSELVAGRVPGRKRADEITVFKNNVGLGLQFAAVASSIYDQAKRMDLGRNLPDEWFLQKMKP
jgi:ornithine cyclodeaminase/alanine dehydrogenase-like protein (mu-crystallin family)